MTTAGSSPEHLLPVCIASRYESTCGICQHTTCVGDLIFAYSETVAADGTNAGTKTKSKLCWAHRDCYSDYPGNVPPPPPPPCRHWVRLGRCPSLLAQQCAFRHDDIDRSSYNSNPDSESAARRWGGKRRAIRNGHKNTAFRIFLMQTYGLDYLRSHTVLDVAGGKGELSWELLNLMGVDSVVVDPRPLSLNGMVKKWINGMYEPRRIGPVFGKWFPSCEDGCSKRTPKRPKHLKCFFDAENFEAMHRFEEDENSDVDKWFQSELEHARRVKWTTKGLTHENDICNTQDDEEFKEPNISGEKDDGMVGIEITNTSDANGILKNCGLVAGFHPDQAAGAIAEYATKRGLPFCIVPCCTYFGMFTKRRLSDGSLVKTYDQLVEWLCETYPEAKKATLDLEGKNVVLYTLP